MTDRPTAEEQRFGVEQSERYQAQLCLRALGGAVVYGSVQTVTEDAVRLFIGKAVW